MDKMKLKNKLIVFTSLSVIVLSCSKSYLDVNNNPNAVTDVPAKTLLPNTIVGMAFSNSNDIGKASALLMQYNANTNPLSVSGAYDTWNVGGFENSWNNEIYTNVLNNLGILVQKTQSKSLAYAGIAKLEMAYTFAMLTDLWGDVPYSEAAKGFDESGAIKFPQPKFDAQMDIYLGNSAKGIKSLFNLVREGLADIAANPPSRPGVDPAADDLVYGGNLSKWTRFGNSLLLKLAMQVSNKVPDTTRNVISDIITNNKPYIDAIDGSLDFNVPFGVANPNAYYLQDIGGSIPNTQMLSARFLALTRGLNDTLRLAKFYARPTGAFVGHDNGSPFTPPVQATRSLYGTYVLGPTRSGEGAIRLITAFRNNFILAEAVLRFGVAGDANTYYQNGIKASMKSTGMTDTEITNYFATNPDVVTLSGTDAHKLEQIILQKYIASVGNALESYNDFRRTGLPVLPAPLTTGGDDPNTFPQRFPYTNNEGSSNPNQPNPRPKTNEKVWWAL